MWWRDLQASVISAIKTAVLMKQMQQETTNLVIVLLPGKSLKLLTAPFNTIPTPGLGSTARIGVTPAEGGETGNVPFILVALLGMSWNTGITWPK